MSNCLIPDRTKNLNGVIVKEYYLTKHNPNKIALPKKRTKPLAGVTIHNTESISVSGTTMSEQYTRATVNGNMRDVRVHFYVDDTEAWQNLLTSWQGWHSGDGDGDGNTATIAIEVIGDSEKAEENAARLAAYLLYKNGLGVESLFTHTYWLNKTDGKQGGKDFLCTLKNARKTCPIWIIPHWSDFVKQVQRHLELIGGKEPEYTVAAVKTVKDSELGGVMETLKELGFSVTVEEK